MPDRSALDAAKAVAAPQSTSSGQSLELPFVSKPTVPGTLSWNGLAENDWTPSDSTGAAGPTRYVELVNDQFAIYNRSGGMLSAGSLQTLTGDSMEFLSDPQVIWDPGTGRFYYVIMDFANWLVGNPGDSELLIGFSKDASPSSDADFCKYSINFGYIDSNGNPTLPDYPKLGDTSGSLLIGANVFDFDGFYTGSDIDYFRKPPSGTDCPSFGSLTYGVAASGIGAAGDWATTLVPAQQADPDGSGWVVASNLDGVTGNTSLSLYPVSDDGSGHAVVGTPSSVSVPSFGIPPNAPQRGSVDQLDTLEGRLTQAVSAIDPTHGSAAIWTQHTVAGGAGTQVRWYEIDPTTHSLWQSGSAAPAGLYAFNGAIAPDRANNGSTQAFGDTMVLGFNTSSSTSFADIRMVAKRDSGSQSASVVIRSSLASQSEPGSWGCGGGYCRWGDYSAATPDPAASQSGGQGRVWLTNMVSGSNARPLWFTQNWEAVPFAGISSLAPSTGYPGLSVVIMGADFTGATAVSFHGASASFVVNSDTQITATVPAGVTAGAVSVSTPDGTFTSDAAFTLVVHVASIAATSGTAGDTVTLTGFGFTGATAVKFNGVTAGFVVNSNTQITATVPALTTDGNVTVTGPAGTSNGVAFDVVPVITDGTGFLPTHGVAGQVVDVTGKSLVAPTALMLDGAAVPFTVVTPGSHLRFVLPATATSGAIGVTTANGSANTSANTPSSFRVNPLIASFAPTSGIAGSSVTITGSGFGSASAVSFSNDAQGVMTSHSATQIVFTVPANATFGPVEVLTPDGDVVSLGSFTPLPSVSGFDHATYKVGDVATLVGANFIAHGPVSTAVNGVVVCDPCVGASATSLAFRVPNTVTGPVTVTNVDGTVTSAPLLIVPRIDSVRGTGTPGNHVLLTGATFRGTTSVAFGNNTEHATFFVGSAGATMDVLVPANATTGKIGVTNAGGTTLTVSDFVVSQAFSVKSFSPARGDYGQAVSITGSGFTGVTAVRFNSLPGTGLAVLDDSHLTVRVPASGSVTGAVAIVNGSIITAPGAFTLLHVAGFSPRSGAPGATVVITGTGFTGPSRVRFGGRDATFTVDSDGQITATVPVGALSGPIMVTVAGASATSGTRFAVQPGP
ncbi:MAG: beta strand repeat-containing protein [Gaiellaceae bacterium]